MFPRFTLLILCLSLNLVQSQQLTVAQLDTIRNTIAAQFGKAAANADLVKFNTTVVTGNDTFFNPGGFNYVFQLKDGQAKRIDRCYFHGTNFNRYLFSYKNLIYQLGGYGMFVTNNHLLRFSFLSNEWEAVKTKGNKPSFIQGLTFLRNDSIFSFNNRRGGNGVEPDSIDPHVYILELSSFTWHKFATQQQFVGYDLNYETPDYLFCSKLDGLLLINKKNLKFEVLNNLGEAIIKTPAAENKGNRLFFEPNSSSLKSQLTPLNLDSLWQKNERISLPIIIKADIATNLSTALPLVLSSIVSLLLLFVLGYYIAKKKAPVLTQNEEDEPAQERQTEKYYKALLSGSQSLLTMEELDEILNIDYMEADSRKLRRFRLLQEINEAYPGLISRIKDEKDRRRFLYRINRA